METTKLFLTEEVNRFDDVKPIIKPAEDNVDTLQALAEEEKEKRKSGIFSGIFKKEDGKESEDEKTDNEDEQTKAKRKPIFGKKAKASPTKEVKPVDHEKTEAITSPAEETKDKKAKSGIFSGMFTKKDKATEDSKLIEYDEEVKTTLKNTSDFINVEIEKYHDVKATTEPTKGEKDEPKEESTEKAQKSKTGIFSGLFSPKDKKEDDLEKVSKKEIQPTETDKPVDDTKQTEDVEKGVLEEKSDKKKPGIFQGLFTKKEKEDEPREPISEDVLKAMKNTHEFLAKEVEVHEDVRLLVPVTLPDAEIPETDSKKEKAKSGIFSGIFGQKDKKESTDVEKVKAQTPIFGKKGSEETEAKKDVAPLIPMPEGDKTTKVVETTDLDETTTEVKQKSGILSKIKSPIFGKSKKSEPIQLTEKTIQEIKETDNFIKREVEVFEDVRLVKIEKEKSDVVTEQDQEEDKVPKKKTGLLSGIFSKKDKKSIDEPTEPVDEDLKKKAETSLLEKKADALPVVETTVIDIKTTDDFLKKEVELHEDVCISTTLIAKPLKEEQIEEKRKSGLFSGLLGKKDKKESTEETIPSVETSKEVKPAIALSEEAALGINATNDFLQKEVEVHEDVRPAIVTAVVTSTTVLSDDEDKTEKRKSGIFSGLFGKKEKKEISIETDLPKEKVEIMESVEIETVSVPNAEVPEGVVIHTNEERTEKTKSGIFDSIFGKKEKLPENEEEKIKEPKKIRTPIFGVKDKKDKASKDISEEVLKSMNDTDKFLQDEITKYEDVKLVVEMQPPTEEKEDKPKDMDVTSPSNSKKVKKGKRDSSESGDESDASSKKSKFGLFSRKPKTTKSDPIKEAPSKEDKIALSDECIENMNQTDSFLKTEVLNHEDVMLKSLHESKIDSEDKETTEIKETKHKVKKHKKKPKRDSSESGEESDTAARTKKFRIFGKSKKRAESAPITEASSKEDKLGLSAEIIKTMNETSDFLTTEVKNYEDVKLLSEDAPKIIQEPPVKVDKKKKKPKRDSSESGEESDTGHKSRRFNIFGKKKAKTTSMEIPIQEASSREDNLDKIEIPEDNADIIEEIITKTTVVVKDDSFGNKLDDTKEFLATEIENFEDVKPIVIAEVVQDTEETKKKRGFGLFGRKGKGVKSDSEDESTEVKESKGIFKIFSKKSKKDESDDEKEKHVTISKVVEEIPDATVADEVLVVTASVLESSSLATKTDSDAEKLTETKTTSAEKEDGEKEPATMKVIEEMTLTRTTTDLNVPDVKARDGSTEDKKIKVVTEEVALHKEVIKDSVDTYELTLDQIKNGADEDLKRLIAQQDSQNIVTSEFDADVQRVVDDLGTTIVTTTTRDRVEELNGGLLEGTFTTVETQCVVTTKQVTEVTETLVSDKNKNVTAEIKDGIEVGPSEIVEIEPTPIELVDKMNDAIKDVEAIAAAARAATAAKASQLKLDLTNKKTPAIPKKTSKSVIDTTKKTTGAPKVAAKSSSSSSSSSTAAVTKSKLPKDREVKPAPVTKGTKAKETKKEDTKKVMESTKGAVKGALKATKAALTPKTKDKAATASTETKKETSPTKPTKTGVATKGTKVFGVKGTGKGALQKTPSVTKIAQDIKTGIKDTKDKATSKAKETALKVEEDVKTEVEIVESKVTTARDDVEDKVKESISDVKVAVHDIKVEIENKVDEIKAEIPKVQSEVDLKIKEIDEDKTKLADDLDKTAEQLQGTKDVISESIKDASAEMSDAVEIQTKQLTDDVKDATDVIDAKLDEIKDKSEQIIPALVETSSSIEKTAKDTKKGFLGKLSEKISGKSSQEEVEIKTTDVKQTKDKPKKGILGKISDKFSSSKDKVEESITDVVQEVKEEASDVKKIVTTEIEEDVDKAKHLGTEKTVDLAEKTVDAADKMITAISDDVQTKQKDLTSDFIAQEKEANKHQQSVMDHAKDVSDGVLQKVDTEKAKIEELSAEVQAKGDKTISEVTTTVKEELVHDVQAVGEALEDIKSSAKEEKKGFLGKLSDKISSIGSKEEKVEKKSKGGIFGKLGSKDKEREKSEPKESDDITTKIAAVKDSFTNGVGSVSTSVKQTVEQKAADLSTIDDKKQELKESTDEAVIVIDEKVSKAKDKTLDELQKLEDSVSSKVQETQKDAEETVIGLQESLEAVKTEVKEQKDATLDAVKDLKDDAEKSLSSTKAEVKETIIATEQKVSDKVDEIKKDIEKSIEKDTQKIIDAKGSVKEDVSKVSSDIQKKTTEQLASIKDGVEETLDKTKVAAETASKEIKEESKGFFDKLSSKLSKKSSDDESSKDKDEPKKKKGIFGKLTKADTKDKDDKEKGKNVSFSGVTESISDKIQDVIEKTDEGKEQLKSDISDAKSTVQKKSEEVAEDLKDSVKEIETGLSDAVKEAESKKVQVIDTGKEISKDIKDSAETTVAVAAEKLSEIKDTVTTTVQEKDEKLKQAIQNEKDALAKSVTATTSDIKQKASDAAAKLDDSMDKTKADVSESVDKVKEAADKLITDLKDEPKGFFDKLSSKLSRKPSDGDSDKEPKKKKGIFGKLTKKDSKDKEELDYTPKTRPTSNIGVPQLVSENIQEVVKQAEDTKEKLKEQAEKLTDGAKTTIDTTVEKVENVEESLSGKVKEEIIKTESQVEDVTKTVDSKIEEIKRETDKLTEVASEIKTDTETKISETKESLQSEMDSIKKETKEQITIVEDTADKIVSENVEKAKASAIEITTDVKEETKGIKEEAKGFFDKLGSKLGIKSDVDSTTDSEKEPKKKKGIFGKSSKSKDQDDIKDTTESSLLGKVPQVISEKVQEVVEHTQETKTKLEEKSETVIDAVKTEIEKTEKGAESIKKTIEHTEEKLSDTIKEKALLTEATISEVVKQADATVQKLTSEVQDIKETSKSKLDSSVSDIKETVQKKLDDGKETTELIKQELVNIKDSAEHTTSEIKEETSKQITVIEDVATKTKDDIIQTTDKVKESAETSITNVKEEAKGFFDKFSSKLSKKSAESESAKETEKEPKKKKGIFGKLGRKDSKEKEETKESVKITSGIVGDLPEVITQKVTEIVDKAEETKEQVKDKKNYKKPRQLLIALKLKVKKISEEVIESSKLEVEKKASEINGTVTSTIENIEDKISSAKQEVVDTKVSIEKSLDDTAADIEKKVSEKTSDIVQSIETTVSETKEEAKGFFDKLSNKLTKKSSEEESTKPSDKEPKKKKGIFGKLTKRSSKDKGDEEEILTETVSAGVSASQNIVDQVKSEATNTIEAAEQLKEDALHAVDKSTTLIKDTTHSVQSQIETKVNDIKMAETEFAKKMSESISNVEASVSDAAQQIDTMAKDTVKSTMEVKDDLKEESKNVIDSIATTTSDIKDTVKEDKEKSKEATNVAIQKAIDTKDSVSHTITETASDIKQETVQQLADTKDSTKADIAQAADKIQESVSGAVTEAKEETKGFFDKISNKLTRKSSDGDSAKDSEKDSKKKKGIFGKLGKKDSKGKDDELTKDTSTELKEQIVLGVQKTAQKIESDIVQTSAFLQSESASALESASKSIDTTVDKGKGTVEVTEKLITEKVQQVEEGAKVTVDDITKTVKDEKKGFFEKINDKLSGKSDQETSKDDEKADKKKRGLLGKFTKRRSTEQEEEKEETKEASESKKVDDDDNKTKKGFIEKLTDRFSAKSLDEVVVADQIKEVVDETIPDTSTESTEAKPAKRTPLFRIESEEDSAEVNLQRRASIKSNILENLTEQNLEALVTDLDLNRSELQSDYFTEKLENKLDDLEKIVDDLERRESITDKEEKIDGKLKRVERKFERMASDTIEKEIQEAKKSNITTPEFEEKRESEFQKVVSQLSTEEVSEFQTDYATLWDEQTFSHTDEWGSKTPESQADVTELPQGEIVYMAPVKLNKDNLVNKAGIEVDVIPRMPSPYASPKLKRKKKSKRAKSELGFDTAELRQRIGEDGGSLPDLYTGTSRGTLMDTILTMSPQRFLCKSKKGQSTVSLNFWPKDEPDTSVISRSLGSSDSFSKGHIMDAVVDWLNQQSISGSMDTMNQNSSFYDDNESLQSSLISERNSSRADNAVPDIFISEDEALIIYSHVPQSDRIERNLEATNVPLIPTSSPSSELTSVPQAKPRITTTNLPEKQETDPEPLTSKDSDITDDKCETEIESYSDRKKFWETVSSQPTDVSAVKKRMSLFEESTTSKITPLKRTSIHEVPIPKPRSTVQSAQSVDVPFDETKEDIPADLVSEYKASFMDPSQQSPPKKEPSTDQHMVPADSVDSDNESSIHQNVSSSYDNTGYISDSGDVEHYISDSEIEDRVPQIRERQMSVFQPPSVGRRSIYERSCSLPTEDLYEVSAKSIQLRKQYYEEQIKKDMVEDELMTEIQEEDLEPEHKKLDIPFGEEEPSTVKSVPEHIDFGANIKSVKVTEVAEALILDDDYDTKVEQPTEFKPSPVKDIINFEEVVRPDMYEIYKPKESDVNVDDGDSRPSDSMEVHVDKSELEESEKMTDVEGTDMESKSIDSGDITELSPKTLYYQDDIPEITISLSGKQRRISEESDDSVEKPVQDIDIKTPIKERSEVTSPINQPEEHIQDTIWEVSVQSEQPQVFEEQVAELKTLEGQTLAEKDEDFSSVRDESDLGSEIHQDHSESCSESKSHSQADIEKLILESLHYQKISPEEAQIIAGELIADIESEIQKRHAGEIVEPPAPEVAKKSNFRLFTTIGRSERIRFP
ncbi:titin-like [Atheta coriaria]|uniref:titin-like n=1 Tax=Dalotia coriaria TaxID=877792 RepID=UPI0031F35C04